MRILHLTSHLDVGGITTYVTSLAQALAARGHRVVVASGGGAWEARLSEAGTLPVPALRSALTAVAAPDPLPVPVKSPPSWRHGMPGAMGVRPLRSALTAFAAAGVEHWRLPLKTSAEFSPQVCWAAWRLSPAVGGVDVIHAHTRVAQVVAHRLWARCGIPYVTTWHGFYRRRLSRRWWPCTGMKTIAISEPVAAHLREVFHVPPDRIRLIPHGIDVARFEQPADPGELQRWRAHLQLPADAPVVGTMARLVPSKGVDRLLDAFAHVRAKIPQARFVIVGDGAARACLERRAARLGLAPSVRFTGTVSDARSLLSLMDVFVFMPAAQEGFGLSLLEAMASGRPIVAIRRGGGSSWVLDHAQEEVLVVDPNPETVGDAVTGLLQNAGEAARLSSRARQAAKSTYDFARVVEQIEQVYEEVTAHGHGGRFLTSPSADSRHA